MFSLLIFVYAACQVVPHGRVPCAEPFFYEIVSNEGPLAIGGLPVGTTPPTVAVTTVREDGVSQSDAQTLSATADAGVFSFSNTCMFLGEELPCGVIHAPPPLPSEPTCSYPAHVEFDLLAADDWPAELAEWPTVPFEHQVGSPDFEACLWNDWCVAVAF